MPENMTMTSIKVFVPKSVYSGAVLVLAAQYYLDAYYIEISDEGDAYGMFIDSKREGILAPDEKAVLNRIIEAAFLIDQAERTKELRMAIMSKVLSPYSQSDET